MGLWERFRSRNRGCRTCRFDGIEGSLIGQFPSLQPVKPLKFGQLFRCTTCGTSWFLHEHKKVLDRIYENWLPLLERWNESRLVLEPAILAKLAAIGGVLGHSKDQIIIPCATESSTGERHDKGIVLVSKQPPIQRPELATIHWADELVAVAPSQFALPPSVRIASSEKWEEAMGFAPVGIEDETGTEYTLGAASQFFDYKGVRGANTRLSRRQKRWWRRWRNVVFPQPAQAYYLVDWFDQCETLLCPPPAP